MLNFERRFGSMIGVACLIGALALPERAYPQSNAFAAQNITNSANKNARYCNLGPWNSGWLGPKKQAQSQPAITLSGTDLSYYKANVEPVITTLYRLNVSAVREGQVAPLKSYLLSMASKAHFTKVQPWSPQTYYGKKSDWLARYNAFNEPAFYGAIFLIAAAQSFAILEAHLSPQERQLLSAWGEKVFNAV